MERQVYLDNSATTRVSEAAAKAALTAMTENYGNPSSLHALGVQAERAMNTAREAVAERLSAEPEEIFFTSGGTESDNLAVLGAAHAKRRAGNKIVTTAIEHPAVDEAMKALENEGFQVVRLLPEADGTIPAAAFEKAIDEKTILVSAMAVNNETGAVLPIGDIAKTIKRKKSPALFHTDAVQAFCKHPLSVKRLGVDLLSVSGHKIHAPKGVGALYVRRGVRILPQIFGGGQEKSLRSGTESVPLICAMGAAVREAPPERQTLPKMQALHDSLAERLREISGVVLRDIPGGSPYILNLSAGRVRAETMLHFLADQGIYISSGSACGRGKPSHVLTAMHVPEHDILSALRVSFSLENTLEDIEALAAALEAGLQTLSHT